MNSLVTYSIISGNLQNAFTIDERTGEIKVARDLDREIIHQFVLAVQAKDGEKFFYLINKSDTEKKKSHVD